jgi:hypothetical protein
MVAIEHGVNGVPYPHFVRSKSSLSKWIGCISRTQEIISLGIEGLCEIFRYAYFHEGPEGEAFAEQSVCQQMAMVLFAHLIHAPNAKLIWRIMPEFDVSHDTIPSDLSKTMTREQVATAMREIGVNWSGSAPLLEAKKVLGKQDWAVDFCTDTIFPVAAPRGEWRIFKSYMRYAVILNGQPVPPPMMGRP